MGMSASQVRFLSLQHRKNNVGRELSTLSNRKMSLSRDMNRVARNYTNALNQTKLQWSNDSGNKYYDINYDLLMKPNEANWEKPYMVTDQYGRVVVDDTKMYYDMETATFKTGDDVPAGKGISYKEIATMISAYSGLDSEGHTYYNNVAGLNPDYPDSQQPVTKNGDGNIANILAGESGEASKEGCEYKILKGVSNYDFENTLRYDVLCKLGLLEGKDVQTFKSNLIALTGSQEGIDTGVYPIGSAYGDYYLALAHLEAYEDYIANDHYFAISNTLTGGNDKNKSVTLKEDDTEFYRYSTNVDSANGKSTTTQTVTTGGTNALSHVNFEAISIKNSDDTYDTYYKYKRKDDGTVETTINPEFSAHATPAFFDQYDLNETGLANELAININVSATGVTYTYTTEDIMRNAYKKYLADHAGSTSGIEHVENLMDGNESNDTDGDIKSDDERDNSLHSEVNTSEWYADIRDGTQDDLGRMIDQFITVLGSATVVDMQSSAAQSAMAKAKAQTKTIFLDKAQHHEIGATHSWGAVESGSRNEADDKNAIGGCYKNYQLPWGSRAFAAGSVDVKTAFNTFMSYFEYYYLNDTEGADALIALPKFNMTQKPGDDAPEPTATFNGLTSATRTITGYKANNTGSELPVTIQTKEYFTNDSAYNCSDRKVYIGGTAPNYSYVEAGTSGAMTRYVSKRETLTRYANTNTSFSYTKSDGNTIQIYGLLEVSEPTAGHLNDPSHDTHKTYAFTTKAAVDSYVNGSWPSSGVEELASTALASDKGYNVDLITMTDGTNNYKVNLDLYRSNSYYNTIYKSSVKGDDSYYQSLKKDVEKKLEKVHDLEEALENSFSNIESKFMDYFDIVCKRISENGWVYDDNVNANANNNRKKSDCQKYLNAMLENNMYFITEAKDRSSDSFMFSAKQATSINKIYQIHDENAENAALAEYEAEKTMISMKERRIDSRMQQLETEQEVINTELDSIKKIRNENIDKYFKIFA